MIPFCADELKFNSLHGDKPVNPETAPDHAPDHSHDLFFARENQVSGYNHCHAVYFMSLQCIGAVRVFYVRVLASVSMQQLPHFCSCLARTSSDSRTSETRVTNTSVILVFRLFAAAWNARCNTAAL